MRKISFLICVVLTVLTLTGCVEVVSEKPIEAEYIAAYDAMETVFEYRYDWINGEFKYLPVFKMVHHDEEYRVKYEQVWSDNTTRTIWKTVTRAEYEEALKELEE